RTGKPAPGAGEVGARRGGVWVGRTWVAPGGVPLPHLDQCVAHRAPVTVQYPAADDDPFAQRLSIVLAGEVVVELPHRGAAGGRGGHHVEVWRGLNPPVPPRPPHRPALGPGQGWRG